MVRDVQRCVLPSTSLHQHVKTAVLGSSGDVLRRSMAPQSERAKPSGPAGSGLPPSDTPVPGGPADGSLLPNDQQGLTSGAAGGPADEPPPSHLPVPGGAAGGSSLPATSRHNQPRRQKVRRPGRSGRHADGWLQAALECRHRQRPRPRRKYRRSLRRHNGRDQKRLVRGSRRASGP